MDYKRSDRVLFKCRTGPTTYDGQAAIMVLVADGEVARLPRDGMTIRFEGGFKLGVHAEECSQAPVMA